MLCRNIIDEFLNHDRFADAGATEQADLSAAQIRFNEIDDLDSGLEHFKLGVLFGEGGGELMDRVAPLRFDGSHLIDRFADDVHHAAERTGADGNCDGAAHILRRHSANHTVCRLHRDAPHAPFAEMLLNFRDDAERRWNIETFTGDVNCSMNFRLFAFREILCLLRAR